MSLLQNYVILLFCVSIVFYCFGYHSIMLESFYADTGGSGTVGKQVVDNIFNIFTRPEFLLMLGVAAVAGFVTGGGSYTSFFIVPLLIFGVIFANIAILPSSYLFDNTLPALVKMIICGFFNIFLILAIIEFVTGR